MPVNSGVPFTIQRLTPKAELLQVYFLGDSNVNKNS